MEAPDRAKRIRLMAEGLPAPDRATLIAELIRMNIKSHSEHHEHATLDLWFKTTFSNGVGNFIKNINFHRQRDNHSFAVHMRHNEHHCKHGFASWEACAAGLVAALESPICMDCSEIDWPEHICRVKTQAIFRNLAPEICTVCQEKCTGVTRLDCGHAFHRVCISRTRDLMCPNCREKIPYAQAYANGMRSDDDEEFDEDQED